MVFHKLLFFSGSQPPKSLSHLINEYRALAPGSSAFPQMVPGCSSSPHCLELSPCLLRVNSKCQAPEVASPTTVQSHSGYKVSSISTKVSRQPGPAALAPKNLLHGTQGEVREITTRLPVSIRLSRFLVFQWENANRCQSTVSGRQIILFEHYLKYSQPCSGLGDHDDPHFTEVETEGFSFSSKVTRLPNDWAEI